MKIEKLSRGGEVNWDRDTSHAVGEVKINATNDEDGNVYRFAPWANRAVSFVVTAGVLGDDNSSAGLEVVVSIPFNKGSQKVNRRLIRRSLIAAFLSAANNLGADVPLPSPRKKRGIKS